MLAYLQELCLQDGAMGAMLVRLALGPSLGDAAILCNINTSGYTCMVYMIYMYMVYMYCFGYYVSCTASTIALQVNAALSDELLVRLHVALGPTL